MVYKTQSKNFWAELRACSYILSFALVIGQVSKGRSKCGWLRRGERKTKGDFSASGVRKGHEKLLGKLPINQGSVLLHGAWRTEVNDVAHSPPI